MHFQWDEGKAAINWSKHGVSFYEAETVFDDSLYIDFYGTDNSKDEDRYLIVGMSTEGRLLIVSYTKRGSSVRIISAREVTKSERRIYESS
jgi:uncharacterized protein